VHGVDEPIMRKLKQRTNFFPEKLNLKALTYVLGKHNIKANAIPGNVNQRLTTALGLLLHRIESDFQSL